jgi:hypothetical protein
MLGRKILSEKFFKVNSVDVTGTISPSDRYVHVPLEATLALRSQGDLFYSDVE